MKAIQDYLWSSFGTIFVVLVVGGAIALVMSLPSKGLALILILVIFAPPPIIYSTLRSRGAESGDAMSAAVVGLVVGPALGGVVMMCAVLLNKDWGRPKHDSGG